MNIFINPDDDRFRAGWRIAAQLFLMILVALALIPLLGWIFRDGSQVGPFALAAGAVISTILAAKGLDYRSWSTYGIIFDKDSLQNIIVAFFLAGGVMGIIFIIEYLFGWLTITGFGWQLNSESYAWSFAGYFFFMVVVGFYEELVFRGYQIVNASEGLNLPDLSRENAVIGAVALSSLVFGLGHAFNPNAGIISTLNIIFAGVMLAFPFIITGRLSWSIGLHIGWNFFQGGVFGFPVSGLPGRASVLQVTQLGPDWLTGGTFGPEAGVMGLLGMVIIIGGIVVYLQRSGHNLSIHPRLGIYQNEHKHAL